MDKDKKVFKIDNVTIECNSLCPFYYCNARKCKLEEHVRKYTRLLREGYTVSMF